MSLTNITFSLPPEIIYLIFEFAFSSNSSSFVQRNKDTFYRFRTLSKKYNDYYINLIASKIHYNVNQKDLPDYYNKVILNGKFSLLIFNKNLISVHFDSFVNSHFSLFERFPPSLTNLEINMGKIKDNTNGYVLPSTVKSLKLAISTRMDINFLSEGLEKLSFEHSFDKIPKLPKSLIELDLGPDFNLPIKKLPKKLKKLKIRGNYSHDLEKSLPSQLTELILVNNRNIIPMDNRGFNKSIDFLPKTLKVLHIISNFNQKVDSLPSSLEELYLGSAFNQPVDNLPSGLKKLFLGDSFDLPLDVLPSSLEELYLGTRFNKDLLNLPSSLIKLSIGSSGYRKNISFMKNLRLFSIGNIQDSFEKKYLMKFKNYNNYYFYQIFQLSVKIFGNCHYKYLFDKIQSELDNRKKRKLNDILDKERKISEIKSNIDFNKSCIINNNYIIEQLTNLTENIFTEVFEIDQDESKRSKLIKIKESKLEEINDKNNLDKFLKLEVEFEKQLELNKLELEELKQDNKIRKFFQYDTRNLNK